MSFTLTTCQNLKIVFLENKKKGENAVDERGISLFPIRDQTAINTLCAMCMKQVEALSWKNPSWHSDKFHYTSSFCYCDA